MVKKDKAWIGSLLCGAIAYVLAEFVSLGTTAAFLAMMIYDSHE